MSRSRRPGRPAARRALNHRGLTASRKVSEAISGLFQTYDKLEVVVEESVDDQNWQSDIRNCDVRRKATFIPRVPHIAVGAVHDYSTAKVATLSGSAKILITTDMLTPEIGFAIGGTGKESSRAYLLVTTNGGTTWSERSELSERTARMLRGRFRIGFRSKEVGYTDANVSGGPDSNQGVYVTSNGGFSWRRLIFAGYTPTYATPTLSDPPVNESYQIDDGVLTLVTLHCTMHELTVDAGNWCPSYLNEFRVGATCPVQS